MPSFGPRGYSVGHVVGRTTAGDDDVPPNDMPSGSSTCRSMAPPSADPITARMPYFAMKSTARSEPLWIGRQHSDRLPPRCQDQRDLLQCIAAIRRLGRGLSSTCPGARTACPRRPLTGPRHPPRTSRGWPLWSVSGASNHNPLDLIERDPDRSDEKPNAACVSGFFVGKFPRHGAGSQQG